MPFSKIVIIGLGLIGGSFARLVKEQQADTIIDAIDTNAASLQEALQDNIIHTGVTSIEECDFTGCDVIIIATHLHDSYQLIKALSTLHPEIPIMDLGSSKQLICQQVNALTQPVCFIGGHPLAGREVTGFQNSNASIFRGKKFLLCPCEKTTKDFQEAMLTWLTSLTFECLVIRADVHDAWMALVSHFPQAYALILSRLLKDIGANWEQDPIAFAGGGLHDHIRLMGSSESMWQDVFCDNKEALDMVLEEFMQEITAFRASLKNDNFTDWFKTSKTIYDRYYQK